MSKGIVLVKRATVSTFKRWNAKILLGAGLLLLAMACTVPATSPTEPGPGPSDSTAEAPGTPKPFSNDGPLPHQDDTPVPGETPTAVETPDNTPETSTGRRPTPSTSDSTVSRMPTNTPTPEPGDLIPSKTLALVMAVHGGSSSSSLKTIVTEPGSWAYTGVADIQLKSSAKAVVLYLPDSDEATVLNSYSLPSYAPQFTSRPPAKSSGPCPGAFTTSPATT